MVGKSRLSALGLAIMLSAFVACGGGEAGQSEQQAASEEMSSDQATSEAAPSTEGGAMQQQEGQAALPEGVTQEMVNEGRQLFTGDGLCSVCHGADATGMPSLGADLTDDEWIHGDGSYEFIVQNILSGVPADQSTTGTAMPPKGGSAITEEQVRAVAAYVYSLSH